MAILPKNTITKIKNTDVQLLSRKKKLVTGYCLSEFSCLYVTKIKNYCETPSKAVLSIIMQLTRGGWLQSSINLQKKILSFWETTQWWLESGRAGHKEGEHPIMCLISTRHFQNTSSRVCIQCHVHPDKCLPWMQRTGHTIGGNLPILKHYFEAKNG